MGRSSPPLAHRPASVRGTRGRGQGVENCFAARRDATVASAPHRNRGIAGVQCARLRAWQAGEENPRDSYEGPALCRPTHATRPRQLRDEVMSGGTQPTYIRVIHRRNHAGRALNRAH